MTTTVDTKQQQMKAQQERIPFHKQNLLVAEERPGYKRRWVNDVPGRIAAFKLAGWTIVEDSTLKTHDSLTQVENQLGNAVVRVVNRAPDAPCRHAVLMEIPLEVYNADKAEQQALIDEQEKSFDPKEMIKRTQRSFYGEFSIDR